MSESENLLVRLAGCKSLASLFDCILEEAQRLTVAEGGTLYLKEGEGEQSRLSFSVMHNDRLQIHHNQARGDLTDIDALKLYDGGNENFSNVATYAALTGKLVNISNAYDTEAFDFSGTRLFDSAHDYHSCSFLTVPLKDHNDEVIGVLQLVNACDSERGEVIPFDKSLEPAIEALAIYAAISLNNQILLQSHKDLLDAFIQCLARVIDVRSPHTSGHCQRVPVLTEMLVQAACHSKEGSLSTFSLDEEEWYELRVAAWLHDCGKLATPDYIVDKSTKLHTLIDGISEVNTRFATLKMQLQKECLEKILNHSGDRRDLERLLTDSVQTLEQERQFIEQINHGGETISPEDRTRIREIAKHRWMDSHGNTQPLLTDEEVDNLSISRGTLNEEERRLINRHIDVTIEILESLPFPRNLKRVPEYAGGHHEKINGTGFPRGLHREEMSIPARIMAIADIFEALTAKDRPYKQPMPLSQSLRILQNMRNSEHIDPELYDMFIREKIWLQYGERFLNPEQLDLRDAGDYL